MKSPKTYRDSIDYYSQYIENQISKLIVRYKFVYHIRHSFQINLQGPDELYNDNLEEEIFEYKLTNLILKYFNTTEGFSDVIIISESKLFDKIIKENFQLKNSKEWYAIKRNDTILDYSSNSQFYTEFHKLAESYYRKEDESDYYNHDCLYNNTNWDWDVISWQDLISKYSMSLNNPIRFSSIQLWMHENGTPRNIKYPREWLSDEVILSIKNYAGYDNIEIVSNHDAYVTLIGSNIALNEILINCNLEYDEEHKRTINNNASS